MGNATSITDQPTGISPEAFEALRNEYEAQKKVEPVLSGTTRLSVALLSQMYKLCVTIDRYLIVGIAYAQMNSCSIT